MLILQRMRQFVRQHFLLFIRRHPIQQIYRLRLVVVVAGDLFL